MPPSSPPESAGLEFVDSGRSADELIEAIRGAGVPVTGTGRGAAPATHVRSTRSTAGSSGPGSSWSRCSSAPPRRWSCASPAGPRCGPTAAVAVPALADVAPAGSAPRAPRGGHRHPRPGGDGPLVRPAHARVGVRERRRQDDRPAVRRRGPRRRPRHGAPAARLRTPGRARRGAARHRGRPRRRRTRREPHRRPQGGGTDPRPCRPPTAVATVLGGFLDTVEANLPGVLADLDTEHLHDLRVAVRRARSVVKLAGDVLAGDVARARRRAALAGRRHDARPRPRRLRARRAGPRRPARAPPTPPTSNRSRPTWRPSGRPRSPGCRTTCARRGRAAPGASGAAWRRRPPDGPPTGPHGRRARRRAPGAAHRRLVTLGARDHRRLAARGAARAAQAGQGVPLPPRRVPGRRGAVGPPARRAGAEGAAGVPRHVPGQRGAGRRDPPVRRDDGRRRRRARRPRCWRWARWRPSLDDDQRQRPRGPSPATSPPSRPRPATCAGRPGGPAA